MSLVTISYNPTSVFLMWGKEEKPSQNPSRKERREEDREGGEVWGWGGSLVGG